jgi:hypothetical protein
MSEPARDPIGDFQRWLMKAGARSVSREVAERVKSTLGGGGAKGKRADVWDTATTEPPGDEPPECQWCPICRAARRYRDSGGSPGTTDLGSQIAGVGDALAGLTRDAFSLFESAVRAPQRPPGQSSAAGAPKAPGAAGTPANGPEAPEGAGSPDGSSDNGSVVGAGVTWAAAVVHTEDEDGEAANEGGHREEGGEPGDAAADRGGDEQVEGTAE